MDFGFTNEQKLLSDATREFVEKECPRELVREWEEEGRFPREVYKKLAELGYFGLPFPKDYGGSDFGVIDFMIVGEELARYSCEFAAGYGLSVFNALNILKYGTEEQKKKYIPAVIDNEILLAVSMTEPDAERMRL